MPANDYLVYFAHGKESGPWGTKIKSLAEIASAKGFAIESPDYSFTIDPDKRVEHLLSLKPQANKKMVLVGSSMGGYVAAHASTKINPDLLFLMAPALYIPGYEKEPHAKAKRMIVVHGKDDDIVPVSSAIQFSIANNSELHIINSGHTLTDSIPFLEYIFEKALNDLLT